MHRFVVVAVVAGAVVVHFQIFQAFSSGQVASLWWNPLIVPLVAAGRIPKSLLGWGRGHSMAMTPLLIRRGGSAIRGNLWNITTMLKAKKNNLCSGIIWATFNDYDYERLMNVHSLNGMLLKEFEWQVSLTELDIFAEERNDCLSIRNEDDGWALECSLAHMWHCRRITAEKPNILKWWWLS